MIKMFDVLYLLVSNIILSILEVSMIKALPYLSGIDKIGTMILLPATGVVHMVILKAPFDLIEIKNKREYGVK